MGINPALVRRAESLPPDTVHVLSREEMRALATRYKPTLVSGNRGRVGNPLSAACDP